MADDATERITILLQARDRDFQRAMDRNNKIIAQMAARAERSTTTMGRTVDANLRAMGTSALSFGRTFAAGIAGGLIAGAMAGFSTNIRGMIADIADLQDAADRLGLGVEDLQGLQAGFKLAGVDIDKTTAGLEIFAQRVGEAANGEGELLAVFKRAGIAIRDQHGELRSTMDLLREYAGIVGAARSEAERLDLANDAFGRGGKAMALALADGTAGLDRMIAQAKEAGLVLDESLVRKAAELDDKFDILQMKASTFFKTISVEGASAVATIVEQMADLENAFDESKVGSALPEPTEAERLAAAIEDVRTEAADAGRALHDFAVKLSAAYKMDAANAFEAMSVAMFGLMKAFDRGEISAADFASRVDTLNKTAILAANSLATIDRTAFDNVIARLGPLGSALQVVAQMASAAAAAVAGIGGSIGVTGSATGGVGKPAERTSGFPKPISFPTGGGRGGRGVGGGGFEADLARAIEQTRERTAALEAEAVALIATAAAGGKYGRSLDYARKKAELLVAAQRDGREVTPELAAEIDALAEAYVAAGDRAAEAAEKFEDVKDQGKAGADAISDVFTSILDGSKSAGEALKDLLREIAAAGIRRGIANLFGGGGGIGGFIGGLLGRASGGPVAAGKPYLVNENTPRSEVFIPSRSGAVLTVPQAQAAIRGGGDVRVTGGDLTLTDDGRIAARIRVEAMNARAGAVKDVQRGFGGMASIWSRDGAMP